jgi:hypothetical protein
MGMGSFYWQSAKDALAGFQRWAEQFEFWGKWLWILLGLAVPAVTVVLVKWGDSLKEWWTGTHRLTRKGVKAVGWAILAYVLLWANYHEFQTREAAHIADLLARDSTHASELRRLGGEIAALTQQHAADSASRPLLTVEARGGYVVVRNDGEAAEVTAVLVVSNHTFPGLPPTLSGGGLWAGSESETTRLPKRGTDSLALTGPELPRRMPFYFVHTPTHRPDSVIASNWAADRTPICFVQVTLLTVPAEVTTTIRKYTLTPGRVTED